MLVGVDIGNSKADLVLLTADGTIVEWRRTGEITPTALGNAGTAQALVNLLPAEAVVDAVWIGAAGADFPDQEEALAAAVQATDRFGTVEVHNDIHALAECIATDGRGIAVVAGAGMNAVGVLPGSEVRFAALGAISGDRGGGFDLGEMALMAACRHVDGRGPGTSLTQEFLHRYGVQHMDDLSRGLDDGSIDSATLVAFGEVVLRHARQGDAEALKIVDVQAHEVAAFIAATARRMQVKPGDVPIALGGSILRHGRDLMEPRIRAAFKEAELDLRFPDFPPVAGAAAAVLHHHGNPDVSAEELGEQLQQMSPR